MNFDELRTEWDEIDTAIADMYNEQFLNGTAVDKDAIELMQMRSDEIDDEIRRTDEIDNPGEWN